MRRYEKVKGSLWMEIYVGNDFQTTYLTGGSEASVNHIHIKGKEKNDI